LLSKVYYRESANANGNMPCSILIYSDDTLTRLAVMRPSAVMPQLFQDTAKVVADVASQIGWAAIPMTFNEYLENSLYLLYLYGESA
jgi:hypothetical protein